MKKFFGFIFSLLFTVGVFAQSKSAELISSGGSYYQDANIQVSWSIGETVVETISSGDYQLTQGFHQSEYEISTTVQNPDFNTNIKIYPNPTKDFLIVNVSEVLPANEILVFDQNGKIILQKNIHSSNEKIDLTSYANGLYYIQVLSGKIKVKEFKVVKNR